MNTLGRLENPTQNKTERLGGGARNFCNVKNAVRPTTLLPLPLSFLMPSYSWVFSKEKKPQSLWHSMAGCLTVRTAGYKTRECLSEGVVNFWR